MSSVRFSGKSLHMVSGKPLLGYLLERIEYAGFKEYTVVATSFDQSDDQIEDYCINCGFRVFRGDLNNVAYRFAEVMKEYAFTSFVRVNGDSPMLDPEIIKQIIKIYHDNSFDMVTNVFPRTYPMGQSVEMLKGDVFFNAYSDMSEPADFEHVTTYFYRNYDKFRIYNLYAYENYEGIKLSVDTVDDMKIFQLIVSKMKRPHYKYGLSEISEIFRGIKNENR